MSRKLALAILLIAVSAFAKDRSVAPTISAASVTGEVSSVSGNVIALAGGLVTIDASSARILFDKDGTVTIAAIKPGMLITATVNDASASGPLTATVIAVLRSADVTLTGTVQSINLAGNTFSMLGRTIRVTADTSFENFLINDTPRQSKPTLANLQTNTVVIVEANAVAGALVASRVTLIAPIPPRPQTTSGTVKSIGSDAWVITVKDRDTTFVVNGATKIIGSPRVGDRVEVLYTVDSANANVAISIVKVVEPPKVVKFTGVVKSIASTQWVITRDDDHKDVVVKFGDNVRLFPAVAVGDHVEILALENSDGTFTLVTIVPKR